MIVEHSLDLLDCEPPHERLNRGDVGTIVHIYEGGRAYEVECVDGSGHTVALITVNAEDVRLIAAGGLLHALRTKSVLRFRKKLVP